MHSPIRLAFLLTSSVSKKADLVASLSRWSLILCLCFAGTAGLVFQTHASNQDATSTQTTNNGKYDFSKVPPVSAPPKPGLFSGPPSGPGYYSVWDMIT
ncbi:hypothetical protein C8R11_1311, partial [Nitrosomonas aestuarii]